MCSEEPLEIILELRYTHTAEDDDKERRKDDRPLKVMHEFL